MKRNLSIIVLLAALTVGAVWLFHKSPAPAPEKIVAAPKPAAPKPAAPVLAVVPQVVAPKAAPVALKTPDAKPAAATPSGDPQAELNTSLSDMISLVQAGDLLTAFERYMPPDELAKMPPEQKAQMEQMLSTSMGDPEAQQAMQMMVVVLQGMQGQTPAMNDTGDKATYQVSDPEGRDTKTEPFSMRKIDGKWYIDPESMGGM